MKRLIPILIAALMAASCSIFSNTPITSENSEVGSFSYVQENVVWNHVYEGMTNLEATRTWFSDHYKVTRNFPQKMTCTGGLQGGLPMKEAGYNVFEVAEPLRDPCDIEFEVVFSYTSYTVTVTKITWYTGEAGDTLHEDPVTMTEYATFNGGWRKAFLNGGSDVLDKLLTKEFQVL